LPPLTVDQKRRYGRQIRLVDIGEDGQERLCNARVTLGCSRDPLAREIASAYVKAAGMITDDASAAEGASIDDDVASLGIRHDIPRSIAEGALDALALFTNTTLLPSK
jgi:hypothetical protein